MYNIVICEDDKYDRHILNDGIRTFFERKESDFLINEFSSGESFLNQMRPYLYDIVFFDVEMGGIDGIETAKILREKDPNVIIIFITNHANNVFRSFSAEPLNYVLKPLSYISLEEILTKSIKKIDSNRSDYFVVVFNGVVNRLPLQDIMYFESNLRIINVITNNNSYQYYGKLNEIQEKISDKDFIRCHQSYIVNLRYVKEVGKKDIRLSNDQLIDVSRTKIKYVKEKLYAYAGGIMS